MHFEPIVCRANCISNIYFFDRVWQPLRKPLVIRQIMVEAAIEGGMQPWQISFKATLSTVTDMIPVLGIISNADELCNVLTACCAKHIVGNRPDRYEPRVIKRRPKQ